MYFGLSLGRRTRVVNVRNQEPFDPFTKTEYGIGIPITVIDCRIEILDTARIQVLVIISNNTV